MGRFLVILGVLGIIAGTVGIFYSMFAPMQQTFSTIGDVTELDDEARALCNDSEELIKKSGASSRNTSGTYGSTTYYYCENSEGVQRDITSDVMSDMITNVTGNIFGDVSTIIGNSFLWTGIIVFGVFLTVMGAIISASKRARMGGGYTVRVNGQPLVMMRGGLNIPDMMDMPSASTPQDTAVRLQKLDHLYQTGVITREEYDRTRQKILDDIV